jgi:hypothetical protein
MANLDDVGRAKAADKNLNDANRQNKTISLTVLSDLEQLTLSVTDILLG